MLDIALSHPARVLHLAVHVHNAFADNHTAHANPAARQAARNLVGLGTHLHQRGIKTHCAFLADRFGNDPIDEAYGGIYTPLKLSPFFESRSVGYMASGFKDRSLSYINPDQYDTLIITGFNRSLCAGETALDARAMGFAVIMPLDCCENDFLTSQRNDLVTTDQLTAAEVHLCTSVDIYNALNTNTKIPVLGALPIFPSCTAKYN